MTDKPTADWPIAESNDLDSLLEQHPAPLEQLAAGEIAAIVLRGAMPAADCQRLIDKLVDEEHLYDPNRPIPAKFRQESVPEGYFEKGVGSNEAEQWRKKTEVGHHRIDIGSSLGYRGSDREAFFAHAAESRATLDALFTDGGNPIELCYQTLEKLSRTKRVRTAVEPDGREYGPAIIRAHYGGYTYKPHFDSVRLREKREDYAVYNFAHQFAGVLVLQNTQLGNRTAQCILHRTFWNEEVDRHLAADDFYSYAEQHGIANVEVVLSPGDLYFFNTGLIHEVPGVAGDLPRVVLATFIGYSADRPEIFVWS